MKFRKGDKCRILRSDTGIQHKDKCGEIVTIIGPPKLGFSPELEYPTSAGYGLIMESRLELVEAADVQAKASAPMTEPRKETDERTT